MMFPSFHAFHLTRKKPLIPQEVTDPASVEGFQYVVKCIPRSFDAEGIIGFLAVLILGGSYSSALTATVFLASLIWLTAEANRHDFMLRSPQTSSATYVHIYQSVGELPAFLFGWIHLLNMAVFASLAAQNIARVILTAFGERALEYFEISLSPEVALLVLSAGTLAVASIIVLLGLEKRILTSLFLIGCKVSGFLLLCMKLSALMALLLFLADSEKKHPILQDENDLFAAALSITVFHNCYTGSKKAKYSTTCAVLGSTFLVKLTCAMLLAAALDGAFSAQEETGHAAVRDTLVNQSTAAIFFVDLLADDPVQHHWAASLLCYLLFATLGLGLCRVVESSRRQIRTLVKDGLVYHMNLKTSSVVMPSLSLLMSCLLPVTTMASLAAFLQLFYHVLLGFAVVYRRYCSSSSPLRHLRNVFMQKSTFHKLSPVIEVSETDSDDTDIDTVVDECKTQVYVSTIMPWQTRAGRTKPKTLSQDGGRLTSSDKAKLLLFTTFCSLFVVSMSLAPARDGHSGAIVLCASFAFVWIASAFWIWLLPAKLRALPADTFRNICVPFLPLLSSLLNCMLLVQLPISVWILASVWTTLGFLLYVSHGYKHSALSFCIPQSTQQNYREKIGISVSTPARLTQSTVPLYPQERYLRA